MEDYTFKKYSEIEIIEEVTDTSHVLIEQDGNIRRASTSQIGKVKTVNGAEPDESGNVELAKPNLNQNDPEAPDYVEGRTHWVERIVADTPTANYTDVWEASLSGQPDGYCHIELHDFATPLDITKKYLIVFDGVGYECTPFEHNVAICWGNLYVSDKSEINTGEPFCVKVRKDATQIIAFNNPEGQHTYQFFEFDRVYHPLSDEYIPDTIARRDEAVCADYQQNDPTAPDYIKNRTHYESWTIPNSSCYYEGRVAKPSATGWNGSIGQYGYLANKRFTLHEGHVFEWRINGELWLTIYNLSESDESRIYHMKNSPYRITLKAPVVDRKTGLRVFSFLIQATESMDEYPTFTAAYKYDQKLKQLDEVFIPYSIARDSDVIKTINDIPADDNGNIDIKNFTYDQLSLFDQENGYKYSIQLRNGNLISSPELCAIYIDTPPTNTNYIDGDLIDTEGLVVVGVYENGTTHVINDYTCKLSDTKDFVIVSVTKGGAIYTASFTITTSPFDPVSRLVDFQYSDNGDGTYTITDWKGTFNGEPSTEMIVPNNSNIIF